MILLLAAAGGVYWYQKQPPERRDRIKEIAGDIGTHFMNEYADASEAVQQARLNLRANLVPSPSGAARPRRSCEELTVAPESLSAQLADLLDAPLRPRVADLRAYLRGNEALVRSSPPRRVQARPALPAVCSLLATCWARTTRHPGHRVDGRICGKRRLAP